MYYADPYNSLNLNNTFENSLRNAKSVLSLQWLYDGLKQFLGRFFVFLLVVVLGFPLLFLFGFWLQKKRKKFGKHMKKSFTLTSFKSYMELKKGVDDLGQFKPALKMVSAYNLKKVPWPLRYTVGQMKKMSSTLLTFTDWLNSRLDTLNTEQYKSESNTFHFLSEKELWDKRNKAYQYWM